MYLTRFRRPLTAIIIAALAVLLVVPGSVLAQESDPVAEATAPEMAKVRFLHGARAGAMDLYVADELALQSLEFGQVSDYVDVLAGSQPLEAVGSEYGLVEGREAKDDPAGQTGYTDTVAKLKPGSVNTVVLVADESGLNELWVIKDKPKPKAGKSLVRFVGLCSNCGPVDFVVDKAKKPLAKNLHYLDKVESKYVPVKPGELDLEMREFGQKKPVADFDPVTVLPGSSSTLYGVGWVIDDSMTLVPVLDAAISSVRALNASREAPALDVYVDGKLAAKKLAPGQPGKPKDTLSGEHLVQVVAAGADPAGGTLAEGMVMLEPGAQAMIVGVGSSLEAVAAPTTTAKAAKTPQIRFVHADADTPTVDIDLRDLDLIEGLAFGDVTDYVTLPSDSSYVWIRPFDGSGGPLHETPLDLGPGNYTAYLGGSADDATVEFVIVQDATAKKKK